jgi:RAP domain
MLCHAMVVLGIASGIHNHMFCELWNSILRKQGDGVISAADLRVILYIQASAAVDSIDLAEAPKQLQSQLDRVTLPVNASPFADAVSKVMVNTGFSHARNVSPFKSIPGLLTIDLACVDHKIAVECDGPEHYLHVLGNSTTRVETGPTKAKRRILQSLGWKVINLDWNEAIENQVSEQWLRGKLLDANADM